MIEFEPEYIMNYTSLSLLDKNHGVLVESALHHQMRIMITDNRVEEENTPDNHGAIVRLLDTYKALTLLNFIYSIRVKKDVIKFVESLRKPWNSESPIGRIRLDNSMKEWQKYNLFQ